MRCHRRGSGVHAEAAGRTLARVPHRRHRHKAARIDGIEGDVRPTRRIECGAQLRLVIDAVEIQAAGEVDQRFLFAQHAEHLDGGLQRGQLAVGIEEVELAAVLTKVGGAVFGVSASVGLRSR